MTFDLFMVWSVLYPSCCGNTGRMLHGSCKYEIAVLSGERIEAHGPKCDIGCQNSDLFYHSIFYIFQIREHQIFKNKYWYWNRKQEYILEFHILINLTVYFYNLFGNFDLMIKIKCYKKLKYFVCN